MASKGTQNSKWYLIIHSLINKALIELENFIRSEKWLGYLYLLTPKEIDEKSVFTQNSLRMKSEEYNKLEKEIEMLNKKLW